MGSMVLIPPLLYGDAKAVILNTIVHDARLTREASKRVFRDSTLQVNPYDCSFQVVIETTRGVNGLPKKNFRGPNHLRNTIRKQWMRFVPTA
jgi:hypothetical protein